LWLTNFISGIVDETAVSAKTGQSTSRSRRPFFAAMLVT
jgi:hypothetical protein